MLQVPISLILSVLLLFCSHPSAKKEDNSYKTSTTTSEKNSNFNAYWYAGKAEITSYKLSQVRYGELHEGTAVNIFVTEDFLPEKQVKADYKNEKNVPILKLNSTKKFTTGIYPYSLMTSTFSPIDTNIQALKISFSSQEWCGNTFMQMNNRDKFNINFYSYFESNADRNVKLNKYPLENEFWNQLRIQPAAIKKGKYKVIPSFEYLALNHQKIEAYNAEITSIEKDNFIHFLVFYPNLKRRLSIKLTKEFPHTIESWEETITRRGKELTTKAEKIKTIQSAYWSKNGASDNDERKELGLE